MDKVPGPPAPTTHTPILLGPRTSGKPASQGTRHPLRPRLGDKDRRGGRQGGVGRGTHVSPPRERGPPRAHPRAVRKQETTGRRPHTSRPLVCDALDSALVDESTRSQGLALGQSQSHSHSRVPAPTACSQPASPGLRAAVSPCARPTHRAPGKTPPGRPAHAAGGACRMNHCSQQRVRCGVSHHLLGAEPREGAGRTARRSLPEALGVLGGHAAVIITTSAVEARAQ